MSVQHLGQLLHGIADAGVHAAMPVTGMQLDACQVKAGDVFFALHGTCQHGIEVASQAISRGARMVLAETPVRPEVKLEVPVIWIDALRTRTGEIAARFYGQPSRDLYVIGVTGTNGKTSTVIWLAQALAFLGYRPAVIGTLGSGLHDQLHERDGTTPDAISVQRLLADFLDAGATHVVMEVSSHGLDQARVAGVRFQLAVFTNLTRDHLDYHGSMEAYGAAKAKLFAWPGLQWAVINVDDAFGRQLLSGLPAGVQGLGLSSGSVQTDVVADEVSTSVSGLGFRLHTPWGRQRIVTTLLGEFNVNNLLAVAGCLGTLGEPFEQVVAALESLQPVPGRMNRLGGQDGSPLVVVDYAHTPDALVKVLCALRAHCAGRLICVFGCGGDRDTGKRPLMGERVERLADLAIVTDDNPRSEDGDAIVAQIMAGMTLPSQAKVERSRARAIERALTLARAGDVVLIAGKGHETCQEDATGKHPFNDLVVARQALLTPFRERRA